MPTNPDESDRYLILLARRMALKLLHLMSAFISITDLGFTTAGLVFGMAKLGSLSIYWICKTLRSPPKPLTKLLTQMIPAITPILTRRTARIPRMTLMALTARTMVDMEDRECPSNLTLVFQVLEDMRRLWTPQSLQVWTSPNPLTH